MSAQREAVCHPEFLEDVQHWINTDRRTTELLVEWIYDNDSQLQRYINTIIDELTSRGVMDSSLLDEQPFTDIAQGPETLFSEAEVDKICNLLDLIRLRAAPVRAA